MFRQAIIRELLRREWTKHRLARESGVNRTSIYEYLNGNREIESDTLERLCVTLGLELKRSDIDT